jgi:hypothetical protein
MERFGGSYAGGPKGRPTIRHIKIHEVPDATTELTELPGGRADWSVAVALGRRLEVAGSRGGLRWFVNRRVSCPQPQPRQRICWRIK